MTEKLVELDDLAEIAESLRAAGRTIVHCHGVFDLLHIGHMRHFRRAKELGDALFVTVTPDQWVDKGPHRPAFHQDLRLEAIASLECVDRVSLNKWPTAVETIKLIRPNVYVKGSEYRDEDSDAGGGIRVEREAIEAVGGKLVFTEDIVFSSSTLINRRLPLLSKEANDFLREFSSGRGVEDAMRPLEEARSLKTLVVGEAIVDEYHYCESLGKSAKDPVLVVRQLSSERFAGGALAVAAQVAAFCDDVTLVSVLGDSDSLEELVRASLPANVDAKLLRRPNAPTIVKRRFIERYPFQKLFEVHVRGNEPTEADNEPLHALLDRIVADFDLVIVADRGHGMLDSRAVATLCERAKLLAVDTQTDAGNRGFNTISKYPRADYACVSEDEIRLEARQRHRDLFEIVEAAAAKLGCRDMTITRGEQGVLCHDRECGFVRVPAFARHFADRLGAGDAVFAVTALCMARNAPVEVIGLVGNAVGAMAIAEVGNREPVDRVGLTRTIVSLFK